MTRSDITREIIILTGTGGIAGLLLWMAVYLAGPIALLPAAGVLLAGLFWLTRKVRNGVALAERASLACMVAAQAGLLAAVIMRVLPVAVHHIL